MTDSPFKPSNAKVYCRPVNWDVACALTQHQMGVELTPVQKAMFARIKSERTKQTDLEEFLK